MGKYFIKHRVCMYHTVRYNNKTTVKQQNKECEYTNLNVSHYTKKSRERGRGERVKTVNISYLSNTKVIPK